MDDSRLSRRHGSEDNNKAAKSDSRDRLSELPDSLLINEILSLLEMKDAVRTTILSKRWKDLWTTVPCLDFFSPIQNQSFIEGALAKWKGDRILKFEIIFLHGDPAASDILDSWLLVTIEKQVEDLSIFFLIYPYYCVPQPLYSCSSVTKLSLFHCNLKIEENVNVRWNQLKSLTIHHPSYLSQDTMNRILSGAPLLEKLVFSLDIRKNLNIQSTSLKMLRITMDIHGFHDLVGNASVLNIWAPNLVSLEISGHWRTKCLLNVPSLTDATLGLDYFYYGKLNEPSQRILREEMFRPAFLSLSHVQKLTLNECSIEFLVDEMKNDNLVLLPMLALLIIESDKYRTYSGLHKTLHRSYTLGDECRSLAPRTIFASLCQLKTIVIVCDVDDNDSIFAVVEILLEKAHALEKMELQLRTRGNLEKIILASEKLLRRASPYAETSKSAKMFSAVVSATIDGQIYGRDDDKQKVHTQSYCCLDYSQIYDVVRYRLHSMRKLKRERAYKSTN